MTTDPTEQARADEHAAGILARHLSGRLAAHVDPSIVATALVALLREHGWRPIPRPQLPGQQPGAGAPPNGEYLDVAAAIRKPKETR